MIILRLTSLEICIWGILFLATPHSGVGHAVAADPLARVAGFVAGSNLKMVEIL